jgi:hypothetical protein
MNQVVESLHLEKIKLPSLFQPPDLNALQIQNAQNI